MPIVKMAAKFEIFSLFSSSLISKSDDCVKPVAIEPISHGNKIGVATVLIQMPKCSANQSLTFGCVLIPEAID